MLIMERKRNIKKQQGFSLINVVISSTLLSFVLAATASTFSSFSRENKAIKEQMGAVEISRLISSVVGSSSCNLLFSRPNNVINSNALTFNPSTANFPITINLDSIPMGSTTNLLVSRNNRQASMMSNSLQIAQNNGLQIQITSPTTANLLINFDQDQLVRGIPNLVFPMLIETSSASPSTVTVDGCGATTLAAQTPKAFIVDRKPSGTGGGYCSSGNWIRRDLNTIEFDTGIGAAINSNQITLPAGTYRLDASSPGSTSWVYRTRLRNTTNNTTIALGTSENTASSYAHTTRSNIYTQFTLNASTNIAIEHYCMQNHAYSNNFMGGVWVSEYSMGMAVSTGDPEVYTTVKLERIE